jgi:IS5 family transposase
VPDEKTIWLFKDTLAKKGTADELFEMFNEQLESEGILKREGSIVDATFVDAPRQRNSREENTAIKEGRMPEGWDVPESKSAEEMSEEEKRMAHKVAQKDTDARWAKKNNETHYGYKDHVKADMETKLITSHEVTAANVHDSQTVAGLVDEKDKALWADSAYTGEEIAKAILAKNPEIKLHIHEKGYRGHPLTEEQKAANKVKSKIRVRVEHIFGHMTNAMGGLYIRCIGIVRAKCTIALKDLAYNMYRYAYLKTPKLAEA